MMTGAEIRRSFLEYFRSKQHTLVPSSSLLPDAPNLLFTNAGMNQFVPIFLGQRPADVSRWGGAVPGLDTRAADTQKCIRAGGKHNDLEDVGLDTYHHTFFEMLGNWSFGDYFKREAIAWAWELVTGVWGFPKNRLYATVYQPGPGEPAEFDQEAHGYWAEWFSGAGLDPKAHVVRGSKKDNFWMMGETGPCGPCSELHVDLTPAGDTGGALVNRGSAQCIEIWNLVFIQFNANPDGSFSALPARHVDTGMGFERVAGILQNTRGFTDFSRVISNYETDVFRPIFERLGQLSGKQYGSTLPKPDAQGNVVPANEQERIDVAFRVIADHIRTLSFAIADGIEPGNGERNYVLRRILRRAVRYGRALGFHEPFFHKLVGVLAELMGDVFPEVRARQEQVATVLLREENAFNRTLDSGVEIFEQAVHFCGRVQSLLPEVRKIFPLEEAGEAKPPRGRIDRLCQQIEELREPADRFGSAGHRLFVLNGSSVLNQLGSVAGWVRPIPRRLFSGPVRVESPEETIGELKDSLSVLEREELVLPGDAAFLLYDTYGFPLDLTELMARERGLTVDVDRFNGLMAKQKQRARAAQKKSVIELSQVETVMPTRFVGYEGLEAEGTVLEVLELKGRTAVVLDTSACYAEMGGQVGDTGELSCGGEIWRVANTVKSGNVWLHMLEGEYAPAGGSVVRITVDAVRRGNIQRHHTVTHLLHWALREVAGSGATQKGSYVGPEKLTFDFSASPLTEGQVADVEGLVNERVLENAPVNWVEVNYAEVKGRKDVLQFFGDKYGERVRVVQIGGRAEALDGYSMELCGGTHCRATGEIGLFRITGEGAIAAGVRRIEAVAGGGAYARAREESKVLRRLAERVNAPVTEIEKRLENLLAQHKELERALRSVEQQRASASARDLLGRARTAGDIPIIVENLGAVDGDTLQGMVNALKGEFHGVIVLGGAMEGAVALVAAVSPQYTAKAQAGRILQQIAPLVGGKGGGRPESARGGGKAVERLPEALARAEQLIAGS